MKKFIITISITLAAAFLMQGFQCGASKEMVAGRQFKKQGKYDLAEEQFRLELSKDPLKADESAHIELIELNMKRGNLVEAAKMCNRAKDDVRLPRNQARLNDIISKTWRDAYNNGVGYLQKFYTTNDKLNLDSAITLFEAGSIVRPKIVNFHYFLGLCYKGLEDQENMLKSFDSYVVGLKEEFDYGFNNGLILYMKTDDVIAKLPVQPKKTQNDTLRRTRVDQYEMPDSTELFLYSSDDDGSGHILKGWRLNFPDSWTTGDKFTFKDINTEPLAVLSETYYAKDDKRMTLKYLEEFQKIDPFNEGVNSSIVDLYTALDEGDVALAKLSQLVDKNKDNPLYLVMWADMLSNSEKFDEAEAKYMEALKIQPDFDYGLRNLAYTYKNMAAQAQKPEMEKKDNDPSYNVDSTVYFPYLRKATENFEKALKTDKFKNDPDIMGELANIYQSMNRTKQMKEMVKMMEEIENLIPPEKKAAYYGHLVRVYSYMEESPEVNQKSKYYSEKLLDAERGR